MEYGALVRVRPAAAHIDKEKPLSRVHMTPEAFLPAAGETLPWSAHLAERLKHGEIEIVRESVTVDGAVTVQAVESVTVAIEG